MQHGRLWFLLLFLEVVNEFDYFLLGYRHLKWWEFFSLDELTCPRGRSSHYPAQFLRLKLQHQSLLLHRFDVRWCYVLVPIHGRDKVLLVKRSFRVEVYLPVQKVYRRLDLWLELWLLLGCLFGSTMLFWVDYGLSHFYLHRVDQFESL